MYKVHLDNGEITDVRFGAMKKILWQTTTIKSNEEGRIWEECGFGQGYNLSEELSDASDDKSMDDMARIERGDEDGNDVVEVESRNAFAECEGDHEEEVVLTIDKENAKFKLNTLVVDGGELIM